MKRIEKYIPLAIDVIDDLILKEQNIVAPEWDNCVANFGAAIRQMGLLTAVTAFSQESDRSTVSKKAMMHYLLRVIRVADGKMCDINDQLLPIVQQKPHDKLLKRQITDAAIAMKLTLRLFIDNPKDEEDDDERNN